MKRFFKAWLRWTTRVLDPVVIVVAIATAALTGCFLIGACCARVWQAL